MPPELLREFADWLKRESHYGDEAISRLLCEPWDGAYPTELLGDDLIKDIEVFLYYMAKFAAERALGELLYDLRFMVEIVPFGSYEGHSSVYVLEMKTRTVLAAIERKTWDYDPDTIQDDLEDLIIQMEGRGISSLLGWWLRAMVRLYIRTEMHKMVRALVVGCDGAKIEIYGDPAKTAASLLIFNNSRVKGWVRGRGLEVDAPPELVRALKALSARPPTWSQAAKMGLLQNPTPEGALRALSLNTLILK